MVEQRRLRRGATSDHSDRVGQDQVDTCPPETVDSRDRQTHVPFAQYGPAIAELAGDGGTGVRLPAHRQRR